MKKFLNDFQSRATKLIPQRKYNPYEKRLKIQGLTSIRGRLVRDDASQ